MKSLFSNGLFWGNVSSPPIKCSVFLEAVIGLYGPWLCYCNFFFLHNFVKCRAAARSEVGLRPPSVVYCVMAVRRLSLYYLEFPQLYYVCVFGLWLCLCVFWSVGREWRCVCGFKLFRVWCLWGCFFISDSITRNHLKLSFPINLRSCV